MKDFTLNLKKVAFTLLFSFVAFAGWSQFAVTSGSGVAGNQQVALIWGVGATGGAITKTVILADIAPITSNLNASDPSVAAAPWNTATLNFSSAPFLTGSTGPKIVYNGANTSPQTITNLVNGTDYYFAVYTWTSTGPAWSNSANTGGAVGDGFKVGPVKPLAPPVATITSTGSTINAVAGTNSKLLFTLNGSSTGAQSLSQLDFVFSVDIASVFTAANFVLKDGASATVGTATYNAGTKTLSITGIASSINPAQTFTLYGDVKSTAGVSSQTISLSTAGVTVTGGGTVTGFTTVTSTINITALSATLTEIPLGTAPLVAAATPLEAGVTSQAIAGFSVTSSGAQTITNVNFHLGGLAAQFSSVQLYKSSSAASIGSSISTNATGNFDLTATPVAINGTPVYFFLVVDVANSVTAASANVIVTMAQTDITLVAAGSNSISINNTISFVASQQSDIVLNTASDGTNATIPYGTYQAASGLTQPTSASLATFKITDGPDNDGLATVVTGLTIQLTNAADVRTIALFDGDATSTTFIAEMPATASNVFSSLNLSAADNGSKLFTVRVTFKSTVQDNDNIKVTVSAATVDNTKSLLKTSGALASATTPGTTNKVVVVATALSHSPASPSTQINTNFSLTLTAVDALGNTDQDAVANVTLSNPTAGLLLDAGAETLVHALAAGTFTWTSLKFTAAGTKNVHVVYAGPPAIAAFDIPVNVIGADITPAPTITLCSNPTVYTSLGDITVGESQNTDFGTGTNQLFYLKLPAGFIFDTSVTPTPVLSSTADISGASSVSYVGNDLVRFSYSVTGTGTKDNFTISGLKVKYTRTDSTAGEILVVNSSAKITGDTEADNVSHGHLIGKPGTYSGLGFTVSGPDPNAVAFSVSDANVQLIGAPAGGTFSGNSVSYSGGNYFFSPSTADTSQLITYTYTDPDPVSMHCQYIVQKQFKVSPATIINNLAISYCLNSPASLPMSLIAGQFAFDFPTGLYYYVFNEFTYKTPVGSPTPIPGPNNVFDPASPIYGTGDVDIQVSYDAKRYLAFPYNTIPLYIAFFGGTEGIIVQSGSYQKVTIHRLPTVAFPSLAFANAFCANAVPVSLENLAIPVPTSNITNDNFVATGTGAAALAHGIGNNWILTPGNAGAVTVAKDIDIVYHHLDVLTGCKNQTAPFHVTINYVPAAVPAINIPSGTNLTICQGNTPPTFTALNNSSVYKWYDASSTLLQSNSLTFTPVAGTGPGQLDINTIKSTAFKVTQSINGCESPLAPLSINVQSNATVSVGANQEVCAGAPVSVTGLVGGGATQATWSRTPLYGTIGAYNNALPTVTAPYTLSATEIANQTTTQDVVFTITTNDIDGPGPCQAASGSLTVRINPIPPAPLIKKAQVSYCALDLQDNLTAEVISPGQKVKWYSDAAGGLGSFQNNVSNDLSINIPTPSTTTFHATQITTAGCEGLAAFSTTIVVVNPLPVPTFKADSLCFPKNTILDASASTVDSSPYDPSGPVSKIIGYNWNFLSATDYDPTNVVYKHKFDAGLFDLRLTAITNKVSDKTGKNCSASVNAASITNINSHLPNNSSLRIGLFPAPAFSIINQCESDFTKFTASNTNAVTGTLNYTWDFGDAATAGPGTTTIVTHQFAGIGTYPVTLQSESDLGCISTITKDTYILPVISDSSYVQTFESSAGGWSTEGLGNVINPATSKPYNDWLRMIPTGQVINSASNSQYAWTTFDASIPDSLVYTYNNKQRSVLNSPCIDMTKIPRPALSFDFWDNTDDGSDGMYVEASVDGATWKKLGKTNEGINWYNKQGIIGLGQQETGGIGQALAQIGWSGDTQIPGKPNGWISAKHALDDPLDNYAIQTRLRLRFVFGSNDDNPKEALNGVAIDNFKIQSRNRLVLAENFTNDNGVTSSTPFNTAFMNFHDSQTNTEVLKIQYHTNLATTGGISDNFYLMNPADQQARANFYGVTSQFKSVIDGFSAGSITASSTWADSTFSTHSLVSSSVSIAVYPVTSDPASFGVRYKIKALEDLPGNKYLIQVAMVEKSSAGQYNLRKLLPDANGQLLTALDSGDVQTDTKFWVGENVSDPTMVYAIVFVQDLNPENLGYKEVLQAGYAKVSGTNTVTGIEETGATLSVYPNPSDRDVTLVLPGEALKDIPVQLIDQLGRSYEGGTLIQGTTELKINTQHLPDGMYIVQFRDQVKAVRKKIVVVHR